MRHAGFMGDSANQFPKTRNKKQKTERIQRSENKKQAKKGEV
jgi:hypothetical protein